MGFQPVAFPDMSVSRPRCLRVGAFRLTRGWQKQWVVVARFAGPGSVDSRSFAFTAHHHIKHRRENKAEERDPDHPGKHRRAQRPAHFSPRTCGENQRKHPQ
ncbi:MAG: hypothetical protein JWL81_368, partial [Verrucomicrobiales bacterium]|nr:hypothetical protein [Verrucomicrobiales bacterium]